ncbi:hypothetical protein [Hymenobacter sp. APR13]|uniref:hypothetical protein n=1 Tax=Hymenobacter sp. APR13 TaxID=1356852 RepID=UPI0009005791|nr:hypothetical protein [Hymenobacter sp. APR13]
MLKKLFCIAIALTPCVGYACSCKKSSVSHAFKDADLIFNGKLIDKKTYTYPDTIAQREGVYITKPRQLVRSLFRITNLYKGALKQDTITITTSGLEYDCGYSFHASSSYLIYAHSTEYLPNNTKVRPYLSASVCSRTKPDSFFSFYEKLLLRIF